MKKRKDGRYQKKITINGTPKFIYARSEKEMAFLLAQKMVEKSKGINIDDKGLSVSEWATNWLKTYKGRKEKATINDYSKVIRLYIVPKIGNIKLKDLKSIHIMNMINSMGNITRKKEVALLTIKQILERAVENDLIFKNVAKGIKLPRTKAAKKEPLSKETIQQMSQFENKYTPFILTLLYTGMRREEIVPLLWEDIDFKKRTISINKAVHFDHNQPIIKSTKNGEIRQVPILDSIYSILYEIRQEHGIVFPKPDGEMKTESAMAKNLKSYLSSFNKFYGTDIKFSYHQLRHTYACILYKADVKIKEAQELMGHKDIKILLDIYTHLDEEQRKKSEEKLNAYINNF